MFQTLVRRLRKDGALVDVLVDCHDRIRAFVDLAVEVGESGELGGAELADAAARTQRYFTKALPLHVQDEEASILPRLRGRTSRIDAALARMHEQHGIYDGMVRRVCVHSQALAGNPNDRAAREALATVARPLRLFLHEHLAAEEKVLFPQIREHFSLAEERLVRREMEDRRRVG